MAPSRPAPRPAGTPGPAGPSGRPPRAVLVLTALVLAQAVGLLAVVVVLVVGLVRGTTLPGPVVFMAVLALGLAALLAGAGRALRAGHRWGRAPVLTVQILLVVLALGWLGTEVAAWSAAVLALAVVTGALVVAPPVVAWTAAPGDRA